MKEAIAMRNHARHGLAVGPRGFTIIEVRDAIGESDPLPKHEETVATDDNA
jgi:hypothetical protein